MFSVFAFLLLHNSSSFVLAVQLHFQYVSFQMYLYFQCIFIISAFHFLLPLNYEHILNSGAFAFLLCFYVRWVNT